VAGIVAVVALLSGCDVILGPTGPPAVDAGATVETIEDITYGSTTDYLGDPVDLKLDLYYATGASAVPRPVVVLVHGGGWSSGSKTDAVEMAEAERLANLGYVTASIDYRLRPAALFDWADWEDPTTRSVITDARHDVLAAVRYLRTNAGDLGTDPDMIALVGRGTGATTAIEAAFTIEDPGDSGNPGVSSHVAGVVSIAGAARMTDLDGADPMVIALHGTEDTYITYARVQAMLAELEAAGAQYAAVTLDGAGSDLDAADPSWLHFWHDVSLLRFFYSGALGDS
jgi:dienelactone hydrolase